MKTKQTYRQANEGSATCECGRDYFFHIGLECPKPAVTDSAGKAPSDNVEANYLAALERGEIVETPEEKFQRENFPLSFWHKEIYSA